MNGRLLTGFLLVPLIATSIAVFTYDMMWHLGWLPDGAPIHSMDAAASLGLGVGILAALMTAVGVVPGVFWLKQRRRLSARWLALLGAVLGNVPFALIIAGIMIASLHRGEYIGDPGRHWYGVVGLTVRTMLGLITGTASALIFWVVAVAAPWRLSDPGDSIERREIG